MKLHYAGFQPNASGFGWATCNANLRRELGKHFELVDEMDATSRCVFMPLTDHDFNPASAARGRLNFAYTFFEFPLGPNAKTNADKYDIVFCGSSWCLRRMEEAGITNGEVLIQGVDHNIFNANGGDEKCYQDVVVIPQLRDSMIHGAPPSGSAAPKFNPERAAQFRIFSGGKFEYRKGQDLVIAAFAQFAQTYPDAHLVCSWFNPWPALITQDLWRMEINTHVRANLQHEFFACLLAVNGLRPDQYTILPQLSQADLACEMANTDVGLFPNRCEGGTNLVLMEYMACARPVVANDATGHADIINCKNSFNLALHRGDYTIDPQTKWAETRIDKIVEMLGLAYDLHRKYPNRNATGADAAETIRQFTWPRAACQIRDTALERIGYNATEASVAPCQ